MTDNHAEKRSWEILFPDDLDYDTAAQIGGFISSFSVQGLLRRTFSPEYYLWKIRDNPAGRGFVSLAVDGNRIIGTTTITRKKAFFRGRPVDAAEIGDTFTDPAYQRQGIFTSLVTASRDRAVKNGVRLIYGTPNDQSLPGYEEKCRFFRRRGLDLFLWVLPLKPANVARLWKNRIKNPSLCGWLDRAFALAINGMSRMTPGMGEPADFSFDSDFDVFNRNLRGRYSFMLSRGRNDLEFRLSDNPEKEYYGLILERHHVRGPEAALVYKECLQDNMRIMFAADFFGIRPSAMAGVWKRAVLLGLQKGFDILAIWTPRCWSSFLSMLPVSPIPVTRKEVILYHHDIGKEVFQDQGRWLFSMLDTDNI